MLVIQGRRTMGEEWNLEAAIVVYRPSSLVPANGNGTIKIVLNAYGLLVQQDITACNLALTSALYLWRYAGRGRFSFGY